MRKLNDEHVPTLGREKFMGRSVARSEYAVHHIPSSRAAIGEYQPCSGSNSFHLVRQLRLVVYVDSNALDGLPLRNPRQH